MAYATYITDALVCGVKNTNTSDRSFLLFTPNAGMILANARSVREERSRQRYALQEFALVRATLIKGRTGWRIGSVEAVDNFYAKAVSKSARGSVANIFRQLRRFIHGEESVENLFDFVTVALLLVSQGVEHRGFIDKVIQLRILKQLGYISAQGVSPVLLETPLEAVGEEYTTALEQSLDDTLKHAVSASHL